MKKIFLAMFMVLIALHADARKLTIIHLNDTHSHIDPQRSGDYKGHGGVIEQAAYIEELSNDVGRHNLLLLHAGDYGQGTSYFTELGGDIEIDVMNAMKFDVACLGNHEFDNGLEDLARRLKNLDTKVTCANYDFSGTPLENIVKPYVIVRKAGLKIGVVGILTDIMQVVDKDIAQNMSYQDPASVVNEWAGFLKDRKGCDLVICLSHIGYEEDIQLASAIRNVDIIVGGHSHTLLDDKAVVRDSDGNDVVVVNNWKWGMNLGKLTLDF